MAPAPVVQDPLMELAAEQWIDRLRLEHAESHYMACLYGKPPVKHHPASPRSPHRHSQSDHHDHHNYHDHKRSHPHEHHDNHRQQRQQNQHSNQMKSEIQKARQNIQRALRNSGGHKRSVSFEETAELLDRIQQLELENDELKTLTCTLTDLVKNLEKRLVKLEISSGGGDKTAKQQEPSNKGSATKAKTESEDDDDFDLFGDDDPEDEERRKAASAPPPTKVEKKPKKVVIQKSSVVFDVKPFDDETDMAVVEANVRSITEDGLLWGKGELREVAYGIKKLVIQCVVEDEKVSVDDIQERIEAFEDVVQSVDIASFQKI